jgi:hypothetical protein
VKAARRQPNCCRNIESPIAVKISQGPEDGRIANAVPLVRAQAAVRIADKCRHIIRCIIKYDKIGRSVAIHVTRFQVITDPQIFQNARTGLRSYRLKGSIAITQSSRDRIRAEGFLLQYHPDIERTVAVKVGHLKFKGAGGADDRSSKREVPVAWKYTHTVWQGSDDVDVAIAGHIGQSQAVRQSTRQFDIGHAKEVLVSIISKNKDVSITSRTRFFFGQHNVEIAVAIEIGSIDRSFTTGENIRHECGRKCSVPEIHSGAKVK